MLRRRAERVSNAASSSGERRGGDNGASGGGGGGALYVNDPTRSWGVNTVRMWSVVIA